MLPSIGAIKSSSVGSNKVEETTPKSIQLCVCKSLFWESSLCGYSVEGSYSYCLMGNYFLCSLCPCIFSNSSNGMSKDYIHAAPVLNMGAICQLTNFSIHDKEQCFPIIEPDGDYFAFPLESFHPVADSILSSLDIK